MCVVICSVVSMLFAFIPCAYAEQLTALLPGSVSGTVEDSTGAMVAPEGVMQATIYANENNGNVTATIEGTAATTEGLSVAIQFTAQLNATTLEFEGQYSDTTGKAPDIPFSFFNIGGLTWKAAISGDAPSPTGERAYNLDLEFVIEQVAIVVGAQLPTDRVFGGQLNKTQTVQVPVDIPSLQASQTLAINMNFAGEWNVAMTPNSQGGSTFAGEASGMFNSVQPVMLAVTPEGGPLSVPVSIDANFAGTLFYLNDSEVAFKGAWVSAGDNPTLGGDISINIPFNDVANFPFNLSGVAQVSTGAEQVPTLSLPFSASGSFPLNLTSNSGGEQPDVAEPTEPVVSSAVKIKHLGVNLAAYDPVNNTAGDFVFTREEMAFPMLFFNFGFIVPANSAGPAKVNPQPTFILPLGTKVHALIDGVVVNVPQLYSNDYSVMLQGEGSDLIFELEHVINVAVQVGDRVNAGDVIGEVSGYDAHNYAGLGLVEIGILQGGNPPSHLCPFDYLDESIRETTLQNITALQNAWEAYLGNSSVYDESAVVIPGCYRRTPVEG